MPLTTVFPAIQPCMPAIKLTCARYAISTVNEQSAFIAQCGHESQGFTRFVENLNYSAQGLLATFPTHFNRAQAACYARNPEKIANHVYANRNGNGDEASGDGWLFRGRGALQITGRANYQAMAVKLGMSLPACVAYLSTTEGALVSAGQFWHDHGLNAPAERGDMLAVTRAINGGVNGLADRCALYGKVRLLLVREGLV